MGSRVNLPAIWITATVTIGGKLAVPVDMLLSVPVASTSYVLIKEALLVFFVFSHLIHINAVQLYTKPHRTFFYLFFFTTATIIPITATGQIIARAFFICRSSFLKK